MMQKNLLTFFETTDVIPEMAFNELTYIGWKEVRICIILLFWFLFNISVTFVYSEMITMTTSTIHSI